MHVPRVSRVIYERKTWGNEITCVSALLSEMRASDIGVGICDVAKQWQVRLLACRRFQGIVARVSRVVRVKTPEKPERTQTEGGAGVPQGRGPSLSAPGVNLLNTTLEHPPEGFTRTAPGTRCATGWAGAACAW